MDAKRKNANIVEENMLMAILFQNQSGVLSLIPRVSNSNNTLQNDKRLKKKS